MSTKTLKIKRVFVYAVYNSLRKTPPKDFPTTGEIKITISNILPAFKDKAKEYVDLIKQAEEISVKVAAKEITDEESKKAVEAINLAWREYTKDHGNDIVEVSLDSEAFTTLKAQFERENWGKTWLANIDEFSEFNDAMIEADK